MYLSAKGCLRRLGAYKLTSTIKLYSHALSFCIYLNTFIFDTTDVRIITQYDFL